VRLDVSKSGIVDDFFVESTSMHLHRSGKARYTIKITGADAIELEVWTTQKARFLLTPRDPPPDCDLVARDAGGEIESIQAEGCAVHLEQMDRRAYVLGLDRDGHSWGLIISSPAYAKARVVTGEPPRDRDQERSASISKETLKSARDLWQAGEVIEAGRAVFEAIPEDARPDWAVRILKAVIARTGVSSPAINRVIRVAANPSKWPAGHRAFRAARNETLRAR